MHDILDGRNHEYPFYGNILLIGTSVDGPTLTPRRIYSVNEAFKEYGDGELVVGCYEALHSGAESVSVIRIAGTPATTTLLNTESNPCIELTTISSGVRYNQWRAVVDDTHVRILNETNDVMRSYLRADYMTIGQLAMRITLDGTLMSHMLKAKAVNSAQPLSSLMTGTYDFMCGSNGQNITPQERATHLKLAYDNVLNSMIDVDIIVPLRAHPDGGNLAFRDDLLKACRERSMIGYGTIGILSLNNPQHPVDMKTTDGRYISVVGMRPVIYKNRMNNAYLETLNAEEYVSSGEAIYAGMLSNILLDQYIDNKPIPIIRDQANLSEAQINHLDRLGYTTLRRSTTRGYVITKGRTLDTKKAMQSVYGVRLGIYIENMIRRQLDVYIGYPMPQIYEIEDKLGKFMEELTSTQAIRHYSFDVSLSTDTVNIDLEFVPTHSIDVIHASLRLITRR